MITVVAKLNEDVKPYWYAAYTSPRHEKKVLRHLEARSIQTFLPLYSSNRQWNERRAVVDLPLFPGYLFVRIRSCDRIGVLEIPGVLDIVGANGRLLAVPDDHIEGIRAALQSRNLQPHPFLRAGGRIRIKSGPLRGLEGVIVREPRQLRMIVSIDSIQRSFRVELDARDLELPELGAAHELTDQENHARSENAAGSKVQHL
jgi:transcription antitermination factor NusG